MKRERFVWIASLCLMAILAFKLPGTMAQRDDDYAFVRTLVDIHRQIVENYVDPVDDQDLREKAIDGMFADLDPFSVYIPPSDQENFDSLLDNSFRGVGIEFEVDEGKPTVVTPIEGSPAFNAGVLAGDVIVKVDGKKTLGLQTTDLAKMITGPLGTKVTLTVQHESGQTVDLTMTREEIVMTTVKGYQRHPDAGWNYYVQDNPKIAYLRITQFTDNTFDEMHDALVGTPAQNGKPAVPGIMDSGIKGLILDLRFDPGGRLDQAIKVVNLFVKDGIIVSTKGRNRPESIVRADGQGTLPYFPMVVLVNEHSASAAEIVSGSLKDNHRALIVGTRTYGKGSVQELIPLEDNGGELKLTVAYYYLPSGRLVHRKKDATDWGVEPQIHVPMDEETEHAIMELHSRQEAIRAASSKPIAHAPTTEPVDNQLQQAINILVGDTLLHGVPATTQPVATTQQ
jgi:carboxyl-terminal processing protease